MSNNIAEMQRLEAAKEGWLYDQILQTVNHTRIEDLYAELETDFVTRNDIDIVLNELLKQGYISDKGLDGKVSYSCLYQYGESYCVQCGSKTHIDCLGE